MKIYTAVSAPPVSNGRLQQDGKDHSLAPVIMHLKITHEKYAGGYFTIYSTLFGKL